MTTSATNTTLTSLSGLTPDALDAILRSGGPGEPQPLATDVTVAAVSLSPIGVGQIADSHRVTAHLSDGTVRTLVAKSAAADADARSAGQSLGLYRREAGFYRDLAADLSVAAPGCWHAEIETTADGEENFLLLLDDLAPAETIDQLTGCEVDIASMIMDQAARLHAPRWADPALEKFDWLHISDSWNAMQGSMYPDLFAGFCERYTDYTEASSFAPGTALVDNLDTWYRFQQQPWTIQHGDFRLDNLLVDASNATRPVNVVDWQTVMLAPGVVDVAYFLGTSLSIDARREHEESLVRRYHEGLLAGGVTDYTWNTCWTDYRRFSFAGYLMTTSASMVASRTDRGDQLFIAMLERSAAQITDLEAISLLASA